MGEEPNNMIEVIRDSMPQLPEPVQLSALKVFSKLVGGVGAYAAAWMKRPIQAIEDGTNAKSIVAARLAQAAAERAAADPLVVDAALARWLPNEIRKQTNKRLIIDHAIEDLATCDVDAIPEPAVVSDVEDDWLNSFERFAEDASSEKMQQLWGRVLSGEIRNPGSFRRSTLRLLNELDRQVAEDFEWASSFVGEEQLFYLDDSESGSFVRLLRLQSAGLITGAGGLVKWQISTDDRGIFSVRSGHMALVVQGEPNKKFAFNAVPLTAVALDLLQIVPNKSARELLLKVGDAAVKLGATGYGIGHSMDSRGGKYQVQNIETVYGSLRLND